MARIPSAYREVKWIASSGTQCIDTGIYPDDTTKLTLDFINLASTGDNIIGNKGSGESDSFRFFNYSGVCYLDYGSGSNYNRISGGSIDSGTRYNLEIGNRYVKNLANGTNIVSGTAVSFSERTYTIFINGNNSYSSNKWFSVKIEKGGDVVFNGVPCCRKSDSAVGLYDLVSTSFFDNDGTGTFTKGSDVIDLNQSLITNIRTKGRMLMMGASNEAYDDVKYINSSNHQYINTGIVMDNNSKLELTHYDYSTNGGDLNNGYVFGASSGNHRNTDRFILLLQYFGDYFYFGDDNVQDILNFGTVTSRYQDVKIAVSKDGAYVNDVLEGSLADPSEEFTCLAPSLLFAANMYAGSSIYYGSLNCVSCKIWQDDVLVRDFKPCLRHSDSVAGMYDSVEGKFYQNQGTGTFGYKTLDGVIVSPT